MWCVCKNTTIFPQVEKLMNRLLYNQYKLKKASVLQRAIYPEVERTLYHGTSEKSVKEICVHGFNRSFCGKNGMCLTPLLSCLNQLVSPRVSVSDILVFSTQPPSMVRECILLSTLRCLCRISILPRTQTDTSLSSCRRF